MPFVIRLKVSEPYGSYRNGEWEPWIHSNYVYQIQLPRHSFYQYGPGPPAPGHISYFMTKEEAEKVKEEVKGFFGEGKGQQKILSYEVVPIEKIHKPNEVKVAWKIKLYFDNMEIVFPDSWDEKEKAEQLVNEWKQDHGISGFPLILFQDVVRA